jgi:hypothetical protein
LASSTAIDGVKVEMLSGDLDLAEEQLRRDYAELTSLDETYYRSTIAGYLARVLFLQGDLSGAGEYSQIALDLADDDDIDAQIRSHLDQARLLAAARDDRALPMAEQAVAQSQGMADLILRGDALVDLAEVRATLQGEEKAEPPLREALALFEQKGDRVSAQRVRALLDRVLA